MSLIQVPTSTNAPNSKEGATKICLSCMIWQPSVWVKCATMCSRVIHIYSAAPSACRTKVNALGFRAFPIDVCSWICFLVLVIFSRKFCKDDGVLRVLYFFYLSNDPVFAGRFLRSRRPGACCAWFGERRRDCSTRWLVLGGFGVLFINPCVFFQIIYIDIDIDLDIDILLCIHTISSSYLCIRICDKSILCILPSV